MKKVNVICSYVLTGVIAMSAVVGGKVNAETKRPITVVVPFDVGGPTDAIARDFTKRLSDVLKQPVIVENQAGAGSRIGSAYVARSKPDGHTLLLTSGSSLTSQPALYKKLPYDVKSDFIGIAKMNHAPQVLVVNPEFPANNLAEFLDYAKANPEGITIASPGLGSAIHLVLEIFQSEAGIKLNHVPFTGSSPAISAVLGGHVMAYMDSPQSTLPHILSGKVKPIAVTTPERYKPLANVPTMAESGLPGVTAPSWAGIFAPKDTPPETLDILSVAAEKAISQPEFEQSLQKLGFERAYAGGAEFKQYIDDQLQHYQNAAELAGLQPLDK